MVTEKAAIREAVIDDVEQLDVIRQAIFPWHSASVATQRSWFTREPEAAKAKRFSAVVGEMVVGFTSAGLDVMAAEPGVGNIYLIVDPSLRGQGIGRTLLDLAETHLRTIGARRSRAYALDEPDVLAWVERQGYQIGANERWSVVDVHNLPPQPPTPVGVAIVSLAELGPQAAHAVDAKAFLDEPGDIANGEITYEDWMKMVWDDPGLDRESSLAALVDGVPAATTMIAVNRKTGRAMSLGTCTLREYRGRGLVKLLKSASLRRAGGLGVTSAFTCNDYTNAPMLAVNDWLGYRVIGGSRSALKQL